MSSKNTAASPNQVSPFFDYDSPQQVAELFVQEFRLRSRSSGKFTVQLRSVIPASDTKDVKSEVVRRLSRDTAILKLVSIQMYDQPPVSNKIRGHAVITVTAEI